MTFTAISSFDFSLENADTLCVPGNYTGRISRTGCDVWQLYHELTEPQRGNKAIETQINDSEELLASLSSYPTGELLDEVLRKT